MKSILESTAEINVMSKQKLLNTTNLSSRYIKVKMHEYNLTVLSYMQNANTMLLNMYWPLQEAGTPVTAICCLLSALNQRYLWSI